jgi:hypothetical protein
MDYWERKDRKIQLADLSKRKYFAGGPVSRDTNDDGSDLDQNVDRLDRLHKKGTERVLPTPPGGTNADEISEHDFDPIGRANKDQPNPYHTPGDKGTY